MLPGKAVQLAALALTLALTLAQAPAPFQWDVPAPMEQAEVPGVITTNGLPMKLHAVRSAWRSDQLLQFFATAFKRAGLYLPPDSRQLQRSQHVQLTALDPVRMIAFTVILQQNEDGSTNVIMGEAHLAERKGVAAAIAPMFPGARAPIENHLEGMNSLTYLVTAPIPEVKQFYAEVLGKQGFRALEGGRYQSQDRLLRVDVRPEGSSTRVMIFDGLPADQSMVPGGVK